MEISKELQDFLNDDHVLDLISAGDYKTLFSMQTLSRRTMNCSQLHSVLLNSGIASTQEILDILGYVPAGFFQDFRSLENITLSNNITSIGEYAFKSCMNLTAITLPTSLTSIGDYAFETCISFKNITIPDGVTSIGDYAFEDCHKLTSITIPSSVTSIGRHAFQGCWKLETIVFKGTEEQWD